jgi:hypothetical protein
MGRYSAFCGSCQPLGGSLENKIMALKDKYRIAYYLDEDELVCITDVWATSSAEAISQVPGAKIIWIHLQVP